MHLPELRVNCTCVRARAAFALRALRSSLSAILRSRRRAALAAAPGVKLVDDMSAEDAHDKLPMPMDTSDQDLIWVGRVLPATSRTPGRARASPSGAAATKSVKVRQPTPSRLLSCSASSATCPAGAEPDFRTSSTMWRRLVLLLRAADKERHTGLRSVLKGLAPACGDFRLRVACDGAVAGWGRWADVGARGCCGPSPAAASALCACRLGTAARPASCGALRLLPAGTLGSCGSCGASRLPPG